MMTVMQKSKFANRPTHNIKHEAFEILEQINVTYV